LSAPIAVAVSQKNSRKLVGDDGKLNGLSKLFINSV